MDPRRKCGATDEEEAQFVAMQMAQIELEPQNSSPPKIVTLDQVVQSSHLIGVLNGQKGFIEHLLDKARRGENDDELREVTMRHVSLKVPLLPFDDLQPQDRVEMVSLVSSPNRVLWGKYLLCQTISRAIKDVGLEVIVTDPKGANAMRLVLHNYSYVEKSVLEVNFDDILPPGTFLALKNPWFTLIPSGWLVLSCENPEEVELFSKKRMESKFPDLEWIEAIATKEVHHSQKRHFWRDLKDDQAAFEKLKGLGNKGFAEKRFSDAIRFYNMALDYCTDNRKDEAMIQSNKSAALLALGCFNAALKCAEVALEVDPGYEKHNYRKTKALIGLGKYEEALNFFEEQFDQFPLSKNKDCNTLLQTVKFLCSRQDLGPTESQLLSIRRGRLSKDEAIPQFFSPLTVISTIEGKGRGVIATQDIGAGQLLICAKAFACHATPINRAETLGDKVKRKIGNMLIFEPELGQELYNLTAGSDLGHLGAGDWRTRHVDMTRILGIVNTNMFGSGEDRAEIGLWIAPSFFNHSCSEHNCAWDVCGEWLVVKAIAAIKKGDELTLAYKSPIVSFEERQSYFNKQGFNCKCRLCQLEESEPDSVKKGRKEILQSLGQLTNDSASKEIEKALEEVDKLVSLREDNISLNFPLLSAEVVTLGKNLLSKGRHGDAISIFKRLFEVANVSVCWHNEGILVALQLIKCHEAKGDSEAAEMWKTNVTRLMDAFFLGEEKKEANNQLNQVT